VLRSRDEENGISTAELAMSNLTVFHVKHNEKVAKSCFTENLTDLFRVSLGITFLIRHCEFPALQCGEFKREGLIETVLSDEINEDTE